MPEEEPRRQAVKLSWSEQMAARAANGVLWLLDVRRRRREFTHFLESVVLILVGLGLVALSGSTDVYLHRGVESGSERPYVVHPSGRDLATNVDLRMFAEDDAADVAVTLSNAGFGYARQEFSWAQIEPAPGQFQWEQYDTIVNALSSEGVQVIAVIVDAPAWTMANPPSQGIAPPDDPVELGQFANDVTSRYGDRLPFLQVWDQPNLARNWGGTPATGPGFKPYLSEAFYAARDGNPTVQIVTPELSGNPDDPTGLSDLQFLDSLYRADTDVIFDVVGIRLDGGTHSPDDRSVDSGRQNFSRAILFRELMVQHGDAGTPIWATSYGWAAGGDVTRDEQAEYVIRGLQRSWSEWPWMGLMVQWAFATTEGSPDAAYAIAPEGSSTPLFNRLSATSLVRRSEIANTGFAPMDSDAVAYEGNWADQHLQGRTFRTTTQVGSSATFRFQGTGLIAFIRSGPESGDFRMVLDGEVVPGDATDNKEYWSFYYPYGTTDNPYRLLSDLDDTEHTLTITLMEPGELNMGGLVVERDPPFIWPVMLLTVSSAFVLFLGLLSFITFVAIQAGHITRRGYRVNPVLPRMPDWVPDRRL